MKNRKLGKLLLVALLAMLFVAILAVNVGAEEAVTVDVTNEAELKAAVAADSTADVVNLVGTIQITDTVTVEKDVTITTATNATVVGKLASVKYDWSGYFFKMFELADGVDLTLTGNVVYSDAGVKFTANNTLNVSGSVQLLAGNTAHVVIDESTTSAAINISGNALVEGNFIYYSRSTNPFQCADGSVKTLTMDGGELNAAYGMQSNSRNATVKVDMKNGIANVTGNLLHLNMGSTTYDISFANMSVDSDANVLMLYGDNATANLSIGAGDYTAGSYIANIYKASSTCNLTLTGGNISSTELWNENGTLTTTKTGGELASNEVILITADNKATFYDDVASALAAAVDGDVIEVWGEHTTGNVSVNASVTFKGNGTVNGAATITVANGKALTFADRTVWSNCSVVMSGSNTVTFTDSVVFDAKAANIVTDASLSDTTVVVSGNATLTTTAWVTNYNNNGSKMVTKTFTMTGGSFSGNYGMVWTTGSVKLVANIENATVSANVNLFHLDPTNSVAGSVDNRCEITMTNVTATAGRYVFGMYPNVWASITLNGANSVYNITGTSPDTTVKQGALVQCTANGYLEMTIADGTFNTVEGKSLLVWNNNAAPAVITLLPAVQDTVTADDVLPVGVHILKADGTVVCCTSVALAMENDADGDTIEINGTVPMGGNITVDKKVTFNGTGTVNGGDKVIFAGAEEITFGGSVTWNQTQIRPVANTTSTVNLTDDVAFSITNNTVLPQGAVVYYDNDTATLTVSISKNAYVSGNWTIYAASSGSTATGTLSVNMNGGEIAGNYPLIIYTTPAAVSFDLKNGTVNAQKNVFHFNNTKTAAIDVNLENMVMNAGLSGSNQFIVVTYESSRVDMTVNGGTYTSTALSFNAAVGTMTVDLQAGSFIGNPVFDITNAGNLTFTVADACVLDPALSFTTGARIKSESGYTYYQTIAKAVAAAKSGETIELIGTNTLSSTLVIDKDLTITGVEGTSVTASASIFNVKNGAKLTLGGYTAWSSNTTCITVGEGGAHIVFTDAVQFTNTKGSDDSAGAIVLDKNDNTDTTIEVLKNKDIEGEPVLICKNSNGWGFDFEKVGASGWTGKKTVKMDCGSLTASYAIVFNIGGVTADLNIANATFSASHDIVYFNNAYVAANDNVGTILLDNVTVLDCDNVFDTQADCRANITVNGGSFTCEDRVFNIDKAASVINLTLNGGAYNSDADSFAIYFNTTSLDALLTITGEASFKGQWFLVCDGLLRTSIADTIKVAEGTGMFASARTKNADGTVTYGSIKNVVAYAPADSVIDIDGVPTINNIQIDKDLTFTGIGTVTAASGAPLFTVTDGAKVTFSGSTVWKYNAKGVVVGEGGAHIVITDTVKFSTTSGSQNGAAIYDELGDVNTTVEILKSDKGAPTLESTGWTIDFEGADNTVYNSTKKVYITGGTFSGSHNIVYNVGGTTADVYVKDATFSATAQVVYINNCYFATAGVDGKGNEGCFELVDITVTTAANMIDLASTDCHATVIVTGGNVYTTSHTFQYDRTNCVMSTTVTGGTYVTKDKFYNGCSNSVTHMTNVNVTAGFDPATNSYLTSGGYAITFGSSGVDNFTIDGKDTVVRAPLRVFAIHDNSNVTLNIDGGLYMNSSEGTANNSRYVIYQSSASGTASTLNLTAKNAQFINNVPLDGSATFHINDAGSTTKASFDNCVLRGSYVIRQSNGTMDLTIKGNTQLLLIGVGEARNGAGSGIFLDGANKKKTVNLISGTITYVDPTLTAKVGDEDVVLNAIGASNGINLRNNVIVDLTMDEGFSIITKGFGIKNNSGRCLDSTITINGGYISSGSDVALGFYTRSSDASKPSTMNINGGYFHSVSGYAVHVYSEQNACVANIHGGTIISETNDAPLHINTSNNDLTDAIEATVNVYGGYFEGHNLCAARATTGGTLNVYGGTFRFANDNPNHWGAPIRSGTGSEVGTVHIWGGNFYSTNTAASGLFTCMNGYSFLTVHGGYNGIGGRVIFEDLNTAVNGGAIVHRIGSQVANHSIYMVDGAAVRLVNGSNGLRFKSVVSAEAMAYVMSIADEGSIKLGTIIAPADFLEDAYTFTAEELDRLGLNYIDLVAENGLVQNEDGSYTICAAITNIKEENVDRSFAATSYIEYTVDGNSVRVYSNYRELKNQRSIAQVARIALSYADRYTAAQREVLELYAPDQAAPVIDIYLIAGQSNGAGCTSFSADFAASEEEFLNGYSNVLYHGVSVGGSTYAGKYIYENVPVKIGYGCSTGDFGPEVGMAKALSQVYNEETGRMAAIVKYAYGGTGLADTISGQNFPEGSWCPPSWLEENGKVDEQKSGGLYRAFVEQIQSAISDYRALGYDVNVVGGYWMQGENDRNNDPDVYAAMFECWLDDLREDVYAITRDEADLSMPMVVGEISDYFNNREDQYQNCLAFTAMQRDQIGALENVYVIQNSTIPTLDYNNDVAHWDSHSALWIGQKVGMTMMSELLDTTYTVSAEDAVAEIWQDDQLIGTYDSLVGAINEAPAGSTVKLLKDLTLYSTLAIGNRNEIVFDGDNHKLDFVIPASDNHGSAIMWYDTDITMLNVHVTLNNNAWGTQLRYGANVTWIGGSINADDFCFVSNTDNAVLNIQSGDFSVNTGNLNYSGVIYLGNNTDTLNISGGTFTGAGQAKAIHCVNKAMVTITGGTFTAGENAQYCIAMLGTEGYLAFDKENATATGGTVSIFYNAGAGDVEDDGMGDIFED